VLLTELGEFYKYLKTVSLNSTIPPTNPLREVNETTRLISPKTFLTKSMRIFGGMDDVVEEVKYKVEVPLKEPERLRMSG